MAVNFIQDFQMAIYKLLSADKDIRLSVDKIYLSVVQDAKYPFILINILQIKNLSKLAQDIYQLEFEISAFARDKNHCFFNILVDKITNILTSEACMLQNHVVAGLKLGNINFQRSSDLITNKLIINYQALLKEIIDNIN